MQFTGLPRLGHEVVFGRVDGALQAALHGRHVVHRLGHHAREFLDPREPVELQRVETLRRILGLRQPRLHLGLGLQFDVAQLLAQAVQVAGQVAQ